MSLSQLFTTILEGYKSFLGLFPAPVAWIVNLGILIFVVIWLIELIRKNVLFLILLVILFPFLIPVLREFFTGLYGMVLTIVKLFQTPQIPNL